MDKSVFSADYKAFLRLLCRAREESGFTQGQVAGRLGERQSWVSRLETGETRMHVIELLAYCKAIGRPAGDFIRELVGALDDGVE